MEPTQEYIAQGKPNKTHTDNLKKRPNKESCQWVIVQRRMRVLMDIDGRPMDDTQEKEKNS